LDTKLKKSNKFIGGMMFVLCITSTFAAVITFMISDFISRNGHRFHSWSPIHIENRFQIFELSLREQISIYMGLAGLFGIIALASLVYLCLAVGDRDEDGKILLKNVDRVYTEIQLLIIGFMAVLCGYVSVLAFHEFRLVMTMALFITVVCIIGIVAAAIGLWMVLSCVRKIKAACFIRQSIIGKIGIALYETVFVGGSLMRKIILLAVLGCLLSATMMFAPVVLILIFVFLVRWVREYEEIKRGIDEVRSGNLTYKIPALSNGEFDNLANGINEISQSSNVAVQNELKNQRMKAELISNVSHDLKTPLTSMVTYIDLLKTEGLTSENAPGYLDILDQKTNRLSQLTKDLFEAAKASSGAIPVKKERVDLLSLINQGLGEMNQGIMESGLEIVIKAELEKYYVWADGQLLWRVVENLFGNFLKYAQENTRVYINLTEQGANNKSSMVILEIKNISRQALNIEADELMERFTRGDESRTTEGSGLGLAIAKDLVKLQGGWLDIKIDGDLFKAVVMLEKAECA